MNLSQQIAGALEVLKNIKGAGGRNRPGWQGELLETGA